MTVMPSINRSKTSYHALPESMKKGSLVDAKCQVSINVTVPKGMERKAEKFMAEVHSYVKDGFNRFMKKEIKKHEEKQEG